MIGLVWNFLQAVLQQCDEFFNISLLLVLLNFGGGCRKKANEMALKGWELISFSVTSSAKVILLFRVPEAVCGQVDLQNKKTEQSVMPNETGNYRHRFQFYPPDAL